MIIDGNPMYLVMNSKSRKEKEAERQKENQLSLQNQLLEEEIRHKRLVNDLLEKQAKENLS